MLGEARAPLGLKMGYGCAARRRAPTAKVPGPGFSQQGFSVMSKKLAIGLVAVVLLAVAGYFGVRAFGERTARAEVERAFEEIRRRGATARFADASVDPAAKAIVLSGVEIGAADGSAAVRIARLTATGAEPPRDGYAEAEVLDLEGVEITLTGPAAFGGTLSYAIPKVMIDRFRGPVVPVAAPAEEKTPFGAASFALRQFAATSAAKATIPAMRMRHVPAKAGAVPVEVAYEGIAAEQIGAGKVRSLLIDKLGFSGPDEVPAQGAAAGTARQEGQIAGIVAARIDTAPFLAVLTGVSPGRNQDDYQAVYGKVVTGSYQVKHHDGSTAGADSFLLEHVGIKPSAIALDRLIELDALSRKGPDFSMAELGDLVEQTRRIIDGLAFRTFAMTGLTATSKGETMRIAAVRLDGFAAGVLDTFEIDRLDGLDADKRPVRAGQLTVRRLDLKALAELARHVDQPSALGALGLFKVVSGVEAEAIEVPYEGENGSAPGQTVRIGALTLGWGNVLGELPTTLRFEMKDVSGPISAADGEPFVYLANAGVTSATMSTTLNIAYEPTSQELQIAPASVKLDKAFSVSLDTGIGDLPKEAFADAAAAFGALGEVTARPLTLKVENLGLAELMLQQLAEASGVTAEEIRNDLKAQVDEIAGVLAQVNPDVTAVAEAIKSFISAPHTLTLSATPRSQTPLLPLLLADAPFGALSAFSLLATAGP